MRFQAPAKSSAANCHLPYPSNIEGGHWKQDETTPEGVGEDRWFHSRECGSNGTARRQTAALSAKEPAEPWVRHNANTRPRWIRERQPTRTSRPSYATVGSAA